MTPAYHTSPRLNRRYVLEVPREMHFGPPPQIAQLGCHDSCHEILSGIMECPKCARGMETQSFEHITVDRCCHCRGLWFDRGEFELLKEIPAAKELDDGNPRVGAKYNEAPAGPCPRCPGQMIAMVSRERPDIRYELCTACGGSFLDAGEFSVLAKSTLRELLKSFL